MRKIFAVLILVVIFMSTVQISSADELADLKIQVQQLMQRIEQLEQNKADKGAVDEMGIKIGTLGEQAGTNFYGADWVKTIKIGGFLQAIYKLEADGDQVSDFDLKKSRLIIAGEPIQNFGFKTHFELEGSNPARDIFIYYDGFPWDHRITFGQWVTPLVYEWSRGSTKLDTIIQPNMLEGSNSFIADRDIGVRLDGDLLYDHLTYTVAVVNGSGLNTADNNSNKDLIFRADIKPFYKIESDWSDLVKGLIVGGGFQTGRQDNLTTPTIDGIRNRYVGTIRYNLKKFNLTSEYAYQSQERTGSLEEQLKYGWYVTGTYDITEKIRAVSRFEQVDPDRSVNNDKEEITTIGAQYFWNKTVRLDLNYRFIEEEGDSNSNNELIFQTQFVF